MTILNVTWFLLVLVMAGGICGSICLALRERLQRTSAITKVLLALSILAAGLLLLRPHEDTFTGLDTSCYRLMAHALANGRPIHDTDRTLMELPLSVRRSVLLEYQQWGRDTRDRSFQITSVTTGAIQPYFYPFLPMAAAGLDILSGARGGDYFVPLLGLLVFVAVLCTGAALGHKYGLLASVMLLIGTPLPAYLFRGFYAEAAGASLAVLVLLGLSLSVRTPLFRRFAPLAIGLSVCFHPVAIVLALPALILLLMDPALTRRGTFSCLIGFAAGLVPLWAMTVWGCQPYGDILDWHGFSHRLSAQPLQKLLALFVLVFLVAVATLIVGSPSLKTRLIQILRRAIDHPVLFLLLLLVAAVPFAIPASLWPGKWLVLSGLHEYRDGVRWGYGALLLAGLIATFWIKDQPRSRALLLLTVFLSPFFFYLKGFEPMGLWSQRRLIPLVLLLIIALTPSLATACLRCVERWGRFPATLISGGLLLAGLLNFSQWPAPYLARHEQGATAWVTAFSRDLGQRLTFFDYYPYSVPFAASGKTRVIGLSEYGYSALPALSRWLAERAGQEEVLWVTAYSNPGLEAGVVLQSQGSQTARFKRIVSKTSLPAECRDYAVEVDILKGTPITNSSGLAVRKILDDGPLALRGLWGCRSPIQKGDVQLPAHWSRNGSGLIGPVPAPGHSVRITLEAAASRDDGAPGQVLKITPPWPGAALALNISNNFTRASGVFTRPADAPALPPTGTFTLWAKDPYNPATIGIRGYPSDLGAQIHLIAIEEIGSQP